MRSLLALAITTASLSYNTVCSAENLPTEEVDVHDQATTDGNPQRALNKGEIIARRAATPDAAALLQSLPGVNVFGAGGVSSLPVIRGLGDDRLSININDMDLISACGNHMNPPMSYIDPSDVERIEVFIGATPVSKGGDAIGGAIIVESAKPKFGLSTNFKTRGDIGASYRSNGNGQSLYLNTESFNDAFNISYSGAFSKADNYTAGAAFKPAGLAAAGRSPLAADEVGSTEFESQNHTLRMSTKLDKQIIGLELGVQHIPYQGFVNQRMDMTENHSTHFVVRHDANFTWGSLESRIYGEHTEHAMQFGPDKLYWYGPGMDGTLDGIAAEPSGGKTGYAAGMPMDTKAEDYGAKIKAEWQQGGSLIRTGIEAQRYNLDDWWDASGKMMWPNTFVNINHGERDRDAVFGELETAIAPLWSGVFGIRYEHVTMDTGEVAAYGMNAAENAEAAAFNATNRHISDDNFNISLQGKHQPSANFKMEVTLASQTRSPNLYERYTWATGGMSMRMINMAGDGNGYVGNLELQPETAHTFSMRMQWGQLDHGTWQIEASPFYSYVEDYIDATACLTDACIGGNNMPGFRYLTFDNFNARLWGMDLVAQRHIALASGARLTVYMSASYLDGKNADTDDNLYNIMPLNGRLRATWQNADSSHGMELELVDGKSDISLTRAEQATAGYGLLHWRSSFTSGAWRFDGGIENILDTFYRLPLGGAYIGNGKTMSALDIPYGQTVPGMGRNIYGSVSYKF